MELKTILNMEMQIIVQLGALFNESKWYMTQNPLFLATSLGTRSEKSIRDSITRKKKAGWKSDKNQTKWLFSQYWTRRLEGMWMKLLKELWLHNRWTTSVWKESCVDMIWYDMAEEVCGPVTIDYFALNIQLLGKTRHHSIFLNRICSRPYECIQQTTTP